MDASCRVNKKKWNAHHRARFEGHRAQILALEFAQRAIGHRRNHDWRFNDERFLGVFALRSA